MNTGNKKIWGSWWRWPLIPVASIAGAFLGSAAFMLIQWLSMNFSGNFDESGWYYKYILPLIRDFIFGFLIVFLGCFVAPQGKLIVGVVLTTLLGALFIFYFLNPHESLTITGVLSGIALLGGAIIAVTQTNEEKTGANDQFSQEETDPVQIIDSYGCMLADMMLKDKVNSKAVDEIFSEVQKNSPIEFNSNQLALLTATEFFKKEEYKQKLFEAQFEARITALGWHEEGLLTSKQLTVFENTLYEIYK